MAKVIRNPASLDTFAPITTAKPNSNKTTSHQQQQQRTTSQQRQHSNASNPSGSPPSLYLANPSPFGNHSIVPAVEDISPLSGPPAHFQRREPTTITTTTTASPSTSSSFALPSTFSRPSASHAANMHNHHRGSIDEHAESSHTSGDPTFYPNTFQQPSLDSHHTNGSHSHSSIHESRGPAGEAHEGYPHSQPFMDDHFAHGGPPGPGSEDHDGSDGGQPHIRHTSSIHPQPPPFSSSHGSPSMIDAAHHANSNHHGPAGSSFAGAGNQHLLHRASISGPIMHHPYQPPSNAAPPHAGDLAAWGNAQGGARPHTADGGMYGQFGFPPAFSSTGMPSSMQDYRGPRASTGSLPGIGEKVFSYQISGDESSLNGKKRPRRRYDEIERLYPCKWNGCTKSYGTLNHLNAHVTMQKHGEKRSPAEFKEMRKTWRRHKREEEQRRQSEILAANEEAMMRAKMAQQHGMLYQGPDGMLYGPAPVGGTPIMYGPPGHHPAYAPHPHMHPGHPGSAQHIPRYAGGGPLMHPGGGSNASNGMVSSQSTESARPYSSAGPPSQTNQPPLGAYLMAHRGSI